MMLDPPLHRVVRDYLTLDIMSPPSPFTVEGLRRARVALARYHARTVERNAQEYYDMVAAGYRPMPPPAIAALFGHQLAAPQDLMFRRALIRGIRP